jgi:hypothetical protein
MTAETNTSTSVTSLEDMVINAIVENHVSVYGEDPVSAFIAKVEGEGDLDGATSKLSSASVYVWNGFLDYDAPEMYRAFDSVSGSLEAVAADLYLNVEKLGESSGSSVMIIDDFKVNRAYKDEKSLAPRAVAAALVAAGILRCDCLVAGMAWDDSYADLYKTLGLKKFKKTKLYVANNAYIGINDAVRKALSI